ncbi:GntR family transcriptional regulator [Candidatus Leptofilum sp.]|uniref:GntR family transcriptional regulator n=1 Tax=Candidatus Leptofilum sp. TaxID=3241576 RepID=UPI003B5BCF72
MTQLSLSQQAYLSIKQQIVSLRLPPGSVINEAELREELNLSRTPIREALQRLAQEKLILIVPRRGMFVTEISITDLQKLFEARLALEPFVARLAAQRGTVQHWSKMDDVLATAPPHDEEADNEKLIAIDEACHQIVYEAAANQFLCDTLRTLYALSLRLWYFSLNQIGNMQDAVLEHQLILDALRLKDEDEAARLMETHIHTFHKELQIVIGGKI